MFHLRRLPSAEPETSKAPDAVFILDTKLEHTAVTEANKLEPYAHLQHVHTQLPDAQPLEDIEELLTSEVGLFASRTSGSPIERFNSCREVVRFGF